MTSIFVQTHIAISVECIGKDRGVFFLKNNIFISPPGKKKNLLQKIMILLYGELTKKMKLCLYCGLVYCADETFARILNVDIVESVLAPAKSPRQPATPRGGQRGGASAHSTHPPLPILDTRVSNVMGNT